jgi:hypothetical protein
MTYQQAGFAMRKTVILLPLVALSIIGGCQSASEHAAQVRQARDADEHTTLGQVQREIRIGMPSADVVGVLGSPNMVTTDEKRRETWVYDKVSTETVSSGSSGGVGALFLGGFVSGASAASTSQRTLTVIVKLDETSRVRDFAYRSSSF